MKKIYPVTDQTNQAPHATLAWGWAGVVPFAALSLAIAFADDTMAARIDQILISYGAIILTFIGGVHWGMEMSRQGRGWLLYTSGICPSLVAVVAILLPFHFALMALAIGFGGLLAFDLWLGHQQLVPQWYSQLRIKLTSAVLACLLVAGLAS